MTKRSAYVEGFEAGLFGHGRNRHRWDTEKAADYDIGVQDAQLVKKEVGDGKSIRVEHLTAKGQ